MTAGDPHLVDDLVEALSLSPDNVRLREKVVDLLLARGRAPEAEALTREGLELTPASEGLRLSLARCAFAAGRDSEALVICESLVERPGAAAAAHMLLARLLIRRAELAAAAARYRQAIRIDPSLADPALDETFAAIIDPATDGADDTTAIDPDEQAALRDQLETLASGMPPAPWSADEDGDAADEDDDDDEFDEPVRQRQTHGGDFGDVSDPDRSTAEIERPRVTFADVGGMEKLKEVVRMQVVHPITHAELFRSYGKSVGGGVLLYGPPGCGKTHLARATAGEVEASFISVGISDVLDMYIGQSEKRLAGVFEQARRHTPAVVFFDEVDALAASRADMRASAGRHLINEFLAQLDGMDHDNEGLLVLGATNAPWHLDPAFRRPGRFDRIIFVPPPDADGRAAILRLLLRDRPVEDIDHAAIAKVSDGCSGADLQQIVNATVEGKLAEVMKSGRPTPITTRDLVRTAKRHVPSTREWFSSAKNHALFANEGGVYDPVLEWINRR
ncbi:MAG: AAA family ATPase [Phycisphaerales bacterium]